MTNFDFKNLRPLLDRAEITIDEASHIFKVSRVSLYSWCDGNTPGQPIILGNTLRLISVIQKAVDAEALPVIDVEKSERMKAITGILRRFLT